MLLSPAELWVGWAVQCLYFITRAGLFSAGPQLAGKHTFWSGKQRREMYQGPIKQLIQMYVASDSPKLSILLSRHGLLSMDFKEQQEVCVTLKGSS